MCQDSERQGILRDILPRYKLGPPLPLLARTREGRHRPELGRGREGLVLRDGEHEEEALAAPEVVVTDGRVVLLPRRVQDVDLHFFSIENHLLPVAVRLGGLVVFHKLRRQTVAAISKGCRETKSART